MDETCYGGGDIAGAVFGTLICGIALAYLLWWLYKNYWKNRKGEFENLHFIISITKTKQKTFFFLSIRAYNLDFLSFEKCFYTIGFEEAFIYLSICIYESIAYVTLYKCSYPYKLENET